MRSPTFHRDFAYIAPDAAQLLADAGVKLVGIDYISAEQFGAPAPVLHRSCSEKAFPSSKDCCSREFSRGRTT
jgi:kynurenine formamidase